MNAFSSTGATVKCTGCYIRKTPTTEYPLSPEIDKTVKSIKETLFSMTKI